MELLANKLRPTKISEVIGQRHLLGENKVLSNNQKKLEFTQAFFIPLVENKI